MSLSICPLSSDEIITISMASIPERDEGMLATVKTLLPYCDNFDLCLNNYTRKHYALLDDPKITVLRTPEEVGARGKFYLTHRTPGYHITIDDDIEYPLDYVHRMMQGIERYGRRAIVGFHGKTFTYNPESHILYNYAAKMHQDTPVHMIGTGTMGWHGDLMSLPWYDMLPGKVDDQVAGYAQDMGIPMIVLAHDNNWMADRPDISLTCSLRRNMWARTESHARVIRRDWRFFTCART